jgi:antitoxin (DNA-binding transcriptional repressor) of toxin-antitoxin stability system
MTTSDYDPVMKSVGIAELRSNLSEHLRSVRRGHSLVVLDRLTPIARIVALAEESGGLVVRRPPPGSPKPSAVPLPPPLRTKADVVELLLVERKYSR